MKIIQKGKETLEMSVDEFIKRKDIQKQKDIKTVSQLFVVIMIMIISAMGGFGMFWCYQLLYQFVWLSMMMGLLFSSLITFCLFGYEIHYSLKT